jgi:hypothetical protein
MQSPMPPTPLGSDPLAIVPAMGQEAGPEVIVTAQKRDELLEEAATWFQQLSSAESDSERLRVVQSISRGFRTRVSAKACNRRFAGPDAVNDFLHYLLSGGAPARKQLLAHLQNFFRLLRDLSATLCACVLSKRHRRLINETDFAHDHSLFRLQCTFSVLISLLSCEIADRTQHSLRCFNEMHC